MAMSDEPPFLTVGTEVSAKYRGAFCEATIKVAKKLVKCKVSYSKGNTALVSNEVVKGPLKVGSPVEVRQPDGQFLSATIMKLTDQSTYTVVFDDGDERTLKRSSLCLKGGRHFDKSESLDNLPLTDPENFGTPVVHSTKKPTRRRRRESQSPSRKEEENVNGKRHCSYPEKFPVGKAVFLENDRRRSCWLPAVIVPAHYIMEESDRMPDTICLRSFKDGRFFASTKDELHDFAPDKEPLSSMLEGDVQPMYMCKPAIERAMAYLDTGELPWDMDLFDKSTAHRSATPTDEEEPEDDSSAKVEEFNDKLKKFHESRGTQILRKPTLSQKDLNLYKLYKLVKENGGMEKVTQELKWRSLYLQMGMPNSTNASYAIKQAYKKYLYAYEMHEKGKQKQTTKESPGWQNRRKRNADERSSEEREKSVAEKPPPAKVMKTTAAAVAVATVKEEEPEEVERAEVMSQNNDAKSETSDQDSSSQAENSSSNGDDCPPQFDHVSNYTNSKLDDEDMLSSPYKSGDRIKVFYGKGKNLCLYEAKIIGTEEGENGRDYLVHYNGWNTRYDEWISESRIAEKVTGPSKAIRPQYSKKKSNKKKSLQPKAPSNGLTTASAPSSVANTPQQQFKRKTSDSKETTPTPLIDKLTATLSSEKRPPPQTSASSCPVTPATGKMVNGGHVPVTVPPSSQLPSSTGKNNATNNSGSNHTTSTGKGNGRTTKRRRPSTTSETQQPTSSLALFVTPTTSAVSTVNHISLVAIQPDFTTPTSLPVTSSAVTDSKRVKSISPCPTVPPPIVVSSTPVVSTTAQVPLKLKMTSASRSTVGGSNGRIAMVTGLNGSVHDGDLLSKSELKAENDVKKVKKEPEESFGWEVATNSKKIPREFSTATSVKTESVIPDTFTCTSLLQSQLLHMTQVDTAKSLICSERVPGIISGDLKPVIQPVKQINIKRCPSPRNRTTPSKKSDVDAVSNPPEILPPSSSMSLPQHPLDSSPPSSHSAAESSPSPPSSPSLPSSLKKLNHSSSSSSLSSSLSTSAPTTALLGKNGVSRLTESTIQERETSEEARMDMDESNLADQGSPSSTGLSDNSSEKERTPPSEQHPRMKGSQSPEGKRRWRSYETEEEFQARRKARKASLNFMVDFSQLPKMTSADKVIMIQEQMKTIQKKWVEIKTEVNNLDRKRRRARKKEREAARLAASHTHSTPGIPSRRSTSPRPPSTDGTSGTDPTQQIQPVILQCH